MTAVAIYTDASIYQGAGSWACVILREGAPMVEHAGRLRGFFLSSAAVEGAAVANALWHACTAALVQPGDVVTLRTDNAAIAARAANGNRRKCEPTIRKAVEYALQLARSRGFTLRVEWVKGHQRLDSLDPHAIYNLRCDQLAGAARKGEPVNTFAHLEKGVAKARARRAAGKGSKREREIWAEQDARAQA